MKTISNLYNIIDNEQNFENLYEYFLNVNFILEKGDEYFYFSRPENNATLENKIDTAFRWIDIVDFMKTFDNSFGAGYRFTPSEILVRIKTDAELETKLDGLKKHTNDKEKHQDILDRILKMMINDSFIEIENEITHQYKVLNSFKYLEQLILTINIPDEVKNEIPE
jgi:hypothetical protein